MKPVLILNSDMQPIIMPIHVIDAQQAINRIFAGTCHVVCHYPNKLGVANPDKLHPYNLEYWPSVIARYEYLHRPEYAVLNNNNLYTRDHGKCRYCGERVPRNDMTVDHYIPRALGGGNTWNNVVLSCGPCNGKKGCEEPKGQWKLEKKPHTPTSWELIKGRLELPVTIYDEQWLQFLPPWGGPVNLVE